MAMTLAQAAEILGIPVTATAEQLRKAYRKLANQYHPDRNPGNAHAEEMMRKINEAHNVFKKHLQNQTDHAGNTGNTNRPGGNAGTQRPGAGYGRPGATGGTTQSDMQILIKAYWRTYQDACKRHEDFLKNKIEPSRKKMNDLESALQRAIADKDLNKKLRLAEDLAHHLRLHKALIAQALILSKLKDQAKKGYDDAVARYNRNQTKGGR